MYEYEEWGGLVGFHFPEIEVLFLVVAVLDVFECRLDIGSLQGVEEEGEKSQKEGNGFVHSCSVTAKDANSTKSFLGFGQENGGHENILHTSSCPYVRAESCRRMVFPGCRFLG